MNIGICGPIELLALKEFLADDVSEDDLTLGLGGDAVNRLIIELLRNNHTVSVFTLDRNLKHSRIVKGRNLEIHFHPLRGWRRVLDVYSKERRLLKMSILQSTVDLVHAHWTYEYSLATLDSGYKNVITVRDNAIKVFLHSRDKSYRLFRLFINNYVIKNSSALISNSFYISEYLFTFYKRKSTVIPNSVDFISSSRKYKGDFSDVILCVNNGFTPLKNVRKAIRAFHIFKRSVIDARLILVGRDYEFGGAAYRWCEKHDLLDGVEFAGFLKKDVVEQYFNKACIFLHCSKEESFGNVLIEAMSYGVPCIGGKKSGAVPWVLSNEDIGECSQLVDVMDEEEIAEALMYYHCNTNIWRVHSQNSILNVESRFSNEAVYKSHIEVYSKLLE